MRQWVYERLLNCRAVRTMNSSAQYSSPLQSTVSQLQRLPVVKSWHRDTDENPDAASTFSEAIGMQP
jgi:hypothetical protein